ncbi:hypothetical protein VTO73DRAFT_3823 [Trametes versicolor]
MASGRSGRTTASSLDRCNLFINGWIPRIVRAQLLVLPTAANMASYYAFTLNKRRECRIRCSLAARGVAIVRPL